MIKKIYPPKLKPGNTIRVISPSISLSQNTQQEIQQSQQVLESLGLKVTYSKNCMEIDYLNSSSIQSRIEDLHQAFKDPQVKAIIASKGGFDANSLLPYINWNLIQANPKIFCGFSDITALNTAIYAKTGLVTYSSSTFSNFHHDDYHEYTLRYFQIALFTDDEIEIKSSPYWTDWSQPIQNEKQTQVQNEGFWIINEGQAEGTIIGENLCTLNLLQGTPYFPDLTNSILFIEDDYESKTGNFYRDLVSLLQQPNADKIKGIVIGRFQYASHVSKEDLIFILSQILPLKNIPIIANVDFGHTTPRITLPIGGKAKIDTHENVIKLIKASVENYVE